MPFDIVVRNDELVINCSDCGETMLTQRLGIYGLRHGLEGFNEEVLEKIRNHPAVCAEHKPKHTAYGMP